MRVPFVRRTLPVLCLIVFAAAISVVRAQSGPLDGPSPPPGAKPDKIVCASIYSGDRTIHFNLDHPIPATPGAIRAEFVRIGQGMQLRALASGINSDRLLGAAIVQAAVNGETWTGAACYYRFPSGGVYYVGCDPSCWGPGCMGIRVPSQK